MRTGGVVILDNRLTHKITAVREAVETSGA